MLILPLTLDPGLSARVLVKPWIALWLNFLMISTQLAHRYNVGCKVIFSDFFSFFEKQDMEIIINVHAIMHLRLAGHRDNSFVNIVKFKVL